MERKQQHFSIGFFILAFVVLLLIQSFLFAPHTENLSYSEFKPLLTRRKVTDLLLDRLDVLLGGRVAEEIIFDDVSTGAEDDLQRATDLVRHMITRYGMSEALGLATLEEPRQALFLQIPGGGQTEYSEETGARIDAEIRQMLAAAHGRVRETLTAKRPVLERLAKLLIDKEVVGREALTELLTRADEA